MNRTTLLLVLALSLPSVARADDASHRAKAEEVMRLQSMEKNVQQVADNIRKQVTDIADRTAGATPTPDVQAKVADFEKQAGAMIDAQVSWSALHTSFEDIYVKTFSEEELDAIIAFYKTPAGSSLLAKMPDINRQIGETGNTHMQTLQPQLQQLFAEFRKNVAPPAASTPAAPSAPAPTAAPAAPVAPPK